MNRSTSDFAILIGRCTILRRLERYVSTMARRMPQSTRPNLPDGDQRDQKLRFLSWQGRELPGGFMVQYAICF